MRYSIPFICWLFHRPGPRVIAYYGDRTHRYRCNCGAEWDE